MRKTALILAATLGLLACDAGLNGPEYEELRVTGTVTLDGAPQAVRVVLYALDSSSIARQLDEGTSDVQGRYELTAQVTPELCTNFLTFVAADFGPAGGTPETGMTLTGCGEHVSDIDG